MFDLDLWREIFQSISKNKLRSMLSGFTVAFAIKGVKLVEIFSLKMKISIILKKSLVIKYNT